MCKITFCIPRSVTKRRISFVEPCSNSTLVLQGGINTPSVLIRNFGLRWVIPTSKTSLFNSLDINSESPRTHIRAMSLISIHSFSCFTMSESLAWAANRLAIKAMMLSMIFFIVFNMPSGSGFVCFFVYWFFLILPWVPCLLEVLFWQQPLQCRLALYNATEHRE